MLRCLVALLLLAAPPVVATDCTTITTECMAAIQTKKDMNYLSLIHEVTAAGVCPWIKTLFTTCMRAHPCCCCDSTFQTAVQDNVASFLNPYESSLPGYSECKNEVTQCRVTQGCPTSFPSNACPVAPAPTPAATPAPTATPSVAVAPSPSTTLPDSCISVTATCNAELSAQAAALTSTNPQVQLSTINQIVQQGGPCPWLKSIFASCMAGGATADCCCCSCAMTDQFKQYGTLFATQLMAMAQMQSLGFSFDCQQDIMQCKEDTCPSAACPAAAATPSSSAIAPTLSAAPAPASSNNPDFCPFVPPTVPAGPCSEVTSICQGELNQKLVALQGVSTRSALLFQVLIAGGPCPYFKNLFATCMAGDTTGCCCCSCTMTTTVRTFSAILSTTMKNLGYAFDCEDDIMQCKEETCPSAACPAVATPSPSSSEDANYCPYVPPPSIAIPDQCKPVQSKCTTELLIRGAKLNNPATQVAMVQEILAAGSPCAYFKNMFASCMADDTHCCCCSCAMTSAMKELIAQFSPQIKSLGFAFDCEDDIMQCKEETCAASGTCPPPASTSPDFSKYCAATAPAPVVAPAPSSASGAGQAYKWRVKLNGTWQGESDCNKILSLKTLLSQKLGAGIPFSPGRLDNAYSCYPFYGKHQLLDFQITDMLTTPDVQQANQEMESMASSNSLASVNAQQKPFTGGELMSLTPYPPLCIDHCDSACNNHCTCTDCHVKITFSLAKSETYKNVLTLNQLQQSRGYIASESNVVETNIDVVVLSGNYDPKKGYAVPNVKEPAPIIPLTVVMTVWSRDEANTAVVRAHMIDNLVGISNEIARITDRGAAFVEKIEGGSSSTGGADTPFVNPATNPTKETSSPAPDSTVPTDDTSAADAVAANEKKKEKETTTIIVSIVVTLLGVGVLFGAMFVFLKRRSNAVPHQKLSSGPDDLEDNRMEMTVPSSNRRLTLGGGEANIDRRSRFELDRKKTKVGSIEVRDNPMNLLHESSTKHDEYQYDDDKIEQSKEQGSVAAVATVVGTGDLPEGWLSNLDEDGDEYWYNHDLGESTYDRPT